MPKDYKNRTSSRYHNKKEPGVSIWKWLLSILLLLAFGGFLYNLKSPPTPSGNKEIKLVLPKPGQINSVNKPTKPSRQEIKAKTPEDKKPKFDFYQILPETEVVVPEHEIKTRAREEHVGKTKNTQYIIQAGSFRNPKEADSLKAQLALMGIESNIEKATVGNTLWNRVKIGPFAKMTSVNSIRTRLRNNKIDVVVMEVNK